MAANTKDLMVRTECENKIDMLRKEHVPVVGDIYIYDGRGCEFVRLSGTVPERPHLFTMEKYSFLEKKWLPHEERTTSADSLAQYYKLFVGDFDEVENDANYALEHDGELPYSNDGDEDSLDDASSVTDIVRRMDGNTLGDNMLSMQILENRANQANLMIKAVMDEQKAIMERKVRAIQKKVEGFRTQVKRLNRVVQIMEVYVGQSLKVTVVAEGAGAEPSEPVYVHQQILYMDEEVAIVDENGQGLDCDDMDYFYKWIAMPKNRDIIAPEQRCVVAMKPRRFKKRYCNDWQVNDQLNRWNFHSFLVIRNGENLYVAESDNLYFASGEAIPTKQYWEHVMRDKWYREQKTEDAQYSSNFYGFLIQGLVDNTDYFGEFDRDVKVMKGEGVEFVFDGETDHQLGTGIKPFPDFVTEKNSLLKRGSRILYVKGSYGDHFNRYYASEYSEPLLPERGIYSLEEFDDGRSLGIYYTPRKRYSWEETSSRRVGRIFGGGWRKVDAYEIGCINFDDVTVDELDMYLNDRTQRKYYESILPLLLEMKKQKRHEAELEEAFIAMMRGQFKEAISDELMREAIDWWKTKVIYVRALTSDDAKSFRMIKKYLTDRLK